jgi:hypothetical protein
LHSSGNRLRVFPKPERRRRHPTRPGQRGGWEYFGSMQRRRSTRSRSDARKPAAVQERQSSCGFVGHSRDRRGGQVEHGCRSPPAGL